MVRMVSTCIGRLVYKLVVLGICTIVAHAAFAAGTPYDGSFSGPGTVTYGTAPVCGSDAGVSVIVKDGEIQYAFGSFPLKMDIAQDGTFRGRAIKGAKHGAGQAMHVKGRISNSVLEADFVVNGAQGHVCSYHWSLRKV
jgi:hypothetical protein